jgi:8-oxo-dGTP pyrophosphatase MutT (NUDIX family)
MHGETEADAALREVREESGYRCEILARLPGMYRGGMGQNVFFLMRPEGAPGDLDGETASTRWVEPAEAEVLIHKTTNTVGRKRDLNVLADALALGEQSGVLRK